MRKLLMFFLIAAMLVIGACSQDRPEVKKIKIIEIKTIRSNGPSRSMRKRTVTACLQKPSGNMLQAEVRIARVTPTAEATMPTRSHGIGKTPETNTYQGIGTGRS